MVHVDSTPIEIAVPPERVREVILDFEKMPEWHSAHFKSIEVVSDKAPKDLIPGDKLKVALTLGNLNFSPVILENRPTRFQWRGSVPGIFTGDHVFEMIPSATNPGHTTFIHYEDFSGMLSFTMNPAKKSGAQNLDGFNTFNVDLKRRCEDGA